MRPPVLHSTDGGSWMQPELDHRQWRGKQMMSDGVHPDVEGAKLEAVPSLATVVSSL